MVKRMGIMILSLAWMASSVMMAHSGKAHIMGVITAMDNQRIEVKTTDGQTKSVFLTQNTTIQRNNEKIARSSLKVGDRVVVHGKPGQKGTLIADEIQVGATKPKGARGMSSLKPIQGQPKERTHGHSH